MIEKMLEILNDLNKQTELSMLNQLGDLVKHGLLVWESTEAVITRDPMSDKFTISSAGRFRLKDQEFIRQLKAENEDLKRRLDAIRDSVAVEK